MENRSTTTRENIEFALPIAKAHGAGHLIVVTDRYHAPRARLIARRLGMPCSTASPPGTGTPWTRQLRYAMREVPAYLYYLLWPGAMR